MVIELSDRQANWCHYNTFTPRPEGQCEYSPPDTLDFIFSNIFILTVNNNCYYFS